MTITHTNIREFPASDFSVYISLSGISHSYAKYERNGIIEYKEATDKMRLGSLVDALLTEPDSIRLSAHNQHLYNQAKIIAASIKSDFGDLIASFDPQINYAAIMHLYDDKGNALLEMPTKGRLDWRVKKHAVLDLKVTDAKTTEQMRTLIDFMGYKNALWNYCKMEQVDKAYVIPFSTKLNKCLTPIAIDCSSNSNEFWEDAIMKFGSVAAK